MDRNYYGKFFRQTFVFPCDSCDWEKVKGLEVEVCTIHSLLQQDDRFKKWSSTRSEER